MMNDVTLMGLQALSECVGIDIASYALVAVEDREGSQGSEKDFVIDCWEMEIALKIKSALLNDLALRRHFLEVILKFWGVTSFGLLGRGKMVWLISMAGQERIEAIVDSVQGWIEMIQIEGLAARVEYDYRQSCITVQCSDQTFALEVCKRRKVVSRLLHRLKILVEGKVLYEFESLS